MIDTDMTAYRRHKISKAVKKTLSILSWINEEAEAHNVNFSAILLRSIKRTFRNSNKSKIIITALDIRKGVFRLLNLFNWPSKAFQEVTLVYLKLLAQNSQ